MLYIPTSRFNIFLTLSKFIVLLSYRRIFLIEEGAV